MNNTTTYPVPASYRRQSVAIFDLWGRSLELLTAEARVQEATATGDADRIHLAVHALIRTAVAFAWPTAARAVWKYEAHGTFKGIWALWRIVGADNEILREWADDEAGMTDETERELVALDLLSNRPETQAFADAFGPQPADVIRAYQAIAI